VTGVPLGEAPSYPRVHKLYTYTRKIQRHKPKKVNFFPRFDFDPSPSLKLISFSKAFKKIHHLTVILPDLVTYL
jgi:hypothetical protein